MSDELTYRGLVVMTLGVDVPDVPECHAPRGHTGCAQHDGLHVHGWVVVHAPAVGHVTPPALTIRCRWCGGRCCSTLYDWEPGRNPCIGLRHHVDYHVFRDGGVEPVGGAVTPQLRRR